MIENQACNGCKAEGRNDPTSCLDCIRLHRDYAKAMGKPDPVMTIRVEASYYASVSSQAELPLYKTWDDVEDCYIRYGELKIQFKGETEYISIELEGDLEAGDMKRPNSYEIYTEDYEEKLKYSG
jgi:hypothetical protein